MPTTNIAVAGLESLQPAVDYKRSGKVGVLSGRNFAWDASGVYSAYASRLVSGTDSIGVSPTVIQTLDLEGFVHVASTSKIWRLIPSSPGSPVGAWDLITTLAYLVHANPVDVPYNFRKWTAAYLGANHYACSYNYGVFRVVDGAPPTYTRLTSGTVTGFPDDATPVISVDETNGRMLYLTATTIYWSNANAPEYLIPELGGAGFQVINERIGGTPFAITPVSVGAIIWTSVGALVMEFVGGTNVFRFWQLSTNALPISAFAITRMPDDDYIILTRLGLFMFNNLSQPQPITPLFNEFLREYLRSHPTEVGHIWYSITDNRVYVAFRSPTGAFAITYALDIVLDRWGVFNENHLGLFTYGPARGQLAYANQRGIASFLLSSIDERKDREDSTAPGTYIGLASEISIGWMRAENLMTQADVVMEVQEALLNRSIPFQQAQITYVDEGFVVAAATASAADEGFITGVSPVAVDEGLITQRESVVNYRLEWITDLFRDEIPDEASAIVVPELVRKGRFDDLWVGLQPCKYLRMRISATEADEYFRINSMDVTVSYMGNLV